MSSTPQNKCIPCWETLECSDTDCPAYQSADIRCWLQGGTHCNESMQGDFLEKMEVCLECDVFAENMTPDDWKETLLLVAEQFRNYHTRITENQGRLKASQKKLTEFKRTSIYLLKELDLKSKELEKERNSLEEKVKEKSREIEEIHEKLAQTTKMAALGRFSAGIAHEINNPLGAILNYVRNLLGNPTVTGKIRGHLELTLKGLFRIEHIVRQILSYAGSRKSELRSTSINQLLKETEKFIHHKITDKNIQIVWDLSDQVPELFIDPYQMQQVFSNIINNGIDACSKEGRIEIATTYKEGHVNIRFTDNGSGMDAESIKKVFDPFYTTKEVGKGTGLGLFISYNILQLYNGTIEITSNQTTGTTVQVRLPIQRKSL